MQIFFPTRKKKSGGFRRWFIFKKHFVTSINLLILSVSSIPFLVLAFPLRYGSRKLSGTNNYFMAGPLSYHNLEFKIIVNGCISSFISLSSQDYTICLFRYKIFFEIHSIYIPLGEKKFFFFFFGKSFSIFSMV